MLAAMPRGIVGGMVGLQAHRETAGQADGVAEARHHAAFARGQDQVLVAHQLAHRRHHLRGEAGGQTGQHRAVDLVRQQPVAKGADAERIDGRESGGIVAIDDQPRHLVRLVRDQGLLEKDRERQLSQGQLRRGAFLAAGGGDAGQLIAGAQRAGLGQQLPQIAEEVVADADAGGVTHAGTGPDPPGKSIIPGHCPAPRIRARYLAVVNFMRPRGTKPVRLMVRMLRFWLLNRATLKTMGDTQSSLL